MPRESLRSALNRIKTDDDAKRMMSELEECLVPDDFRSEAPQTSPEQDNILNMYLSFLRDILLRQTHHNSSEEDLMKAAFPSNNTKQLIKQQQMFLTSAFLKARPHSNQSTEQISYTTLAKYRDVMLFWNSRVYSQRKESPPDKKLLFDQMTSQIQYLKQKYGSEVTPKLDSDLKKRGLESVNDPSALDAPVPVPGNPHIMRGFPHVTPAPASWWKEGDPTEPLVDYETLPSTMKVGFPSSTRELLGWESDEIPDRLKPFITFGEPTEFVDACDEEEEEKKNKKQKLE